MGPDDVGAMADGTGRPPIEPFPIGTRLLHIGPPKTGTTSLQAAFWAAREEALAQGVRYAGTSRHSYRAVLAVTGRRTIGRNPVTPSISHWEAILHEIRTAPERRTVLSSEGFSYARADKVERVLRDLDPSRVQVVVTLRPVARLLTSEWQEHVQSGLRVSQEAWLDALLRHPDQKLGRGFWHRQRHDRLIERWAAPIGLDRVTAVVVDETDHDRLYEVFEALTGLRSGTLQPVDTLGNRSLTLAEIRAIEAFADRWEAEGLEMQGFHDLARMRVAAYMKTRRPGSDESRIDTPQWALDQAGEIAKEIVAGIEAMGVRVIGEPASLLGVPRSLPGDRLPPVLVAPEVAATMAMGVVQASRLRDGRTAGGGIEPLELARVPTRELVTALVRRYLPGRRRRTPAGADRRPD